MSDGGMGEQRDNFHCSCERSHSLRVGFYFNVRLRPDRDISCTEVKTRKLLGIVTGKLQKSRVNRGARLE
jgi:hypothetical protein